ncbi:MAG: DASS family sodium-coupled anion symporter [Proteobacteria bacterium]|nr:DASS family sodium-coupled anion symporter [Pseudomonadota bacterium]MDA0992077.1 DASS family sodium-coupled anion symporter [Pseudomonadota bacterium]
MTTSTEQTANQPLETYQIVGRILGPAIFAVMFAVDQSQAFMSADAWRVAAVGLWMAVWWATEAIPVPVTALLPLVIFDPLGILSIRDAAAPYANPTIYLYLGGFIMALTLERWSLHRRIALAIVSRTGTDGRRLIGGFMLVCATLSMWMTNTSTTMMLLPIVLSVTVVIRDNIPDLSEKTRNNFQIAMLLGLAYSASIGGLATLIGTPPNALLMGFMADNYGIEISFARWMLVGIPVSFIMLPIAWIGLTRFLFPCDIPSSAAVRAHLRELKAELGPMSIAEKRVAIAFGCLVAAWMFRQPVTEALGISGVSDTGIVLTIALLLFLLPSGDSSNPRLAVWEDMARLPWGVLVLFGGGLSLATAVSDSGLALWLGEQLAPLSVWGTAVLVVAAVTLVIFLTELTSNLATTATLLPVMGAIAIQAGVPPIVLTVPITIAASCAFMLPVATPPNAIVFSTGAISIPQMVKAGVFLNIIGIIIVSAAALFLAPVLLT